MSYHRLTWYKFRKKRFGFLNLSSLLFFLMYLFPPAHNMGPDVSLKHGTFRASLDGSELAENSLSSDQNREQKKEILANAVYHPKLEEIRKRLMRKKSKVFTENTNQLPQSNKSMLEVESVFGKIKSERKSLAGLRLKLGKQKYELMFSSSNSYNSSTNPSPG